MTPEDLSGRILHRDADVLVIDKPAGIAVHQAPGAGPSLEAALEPLRFGLKWLPGLAHRLDRETSGCLVLGRHPAALRRLNQLFAEGAVEKTYWAVVEGAPGGSEGVIDLALLKVHRRGAWTMIVDPGGQRAETRWRTLGQAEGRTWLELSPRTGRMHQLRVHLEALGTAVVGDRRYGTAGGPGERMHLHARSVRLSLKPGRPPIEAVAPPPAHMLPALAALGYRP